MIFKNAARRIAAEQIDMGVELRGTHCDTSAMPCSRISSRNAGSVSVRRHTSPPRRLANGSIDHGRLNVSASRSVLATVSEALRSGTAPPA